MNSETLVYLNGKMVPANEASNVGSRFVPVHGSQDRVACRSFETDINVPPHGRPLLPRQQATVHHLNDAELAGRINEPRTSS